MSDQKDLALALRRAEFTPGARHVPGLLVMLAGNDEDLLVLAERALAKAGPKGLAAAKHGLADASAAAPLRVRLARVLARVGKDAGDEARAALLAQADDPEPRVRRAVAIAVGKLGDGGDAGDFLASRLEDERDASVRRALVEALGKLGGARATAALATLEPGDDAELARLLGKARLMIARGADTPGVEGAAGAAPVATVDLSRAAAGEYVVWLHCRPGMAELLVDELRGLKELRGVRVRAADRVEATLRGAPAALFAARLWDELGFVLGDELAGGDPEEQARVLVDVLCGPATRTVFATWTQGPWRFRLDWAGGGPRRALTWKVAADVAARSPELINAPRQAPWEVRCLVGAGGGGSGGGEDEDDGGGGPISIELVPQRWEDPRFKYRLGDVPAASHPTIAAALARVGGANERDVVWDPFVGSGAELVERAFLGPYAVLYGTDIDAKAVDIAEKNLAAADVRAMLVVADACAWTPPRAPTLILTNPPMGRRVHRGDVGPFLERFIVHAAKVLAPGGRLVWASPLPARTAEVAQKAGLRVEPICGFDMGGFSAQIQRFTAPKR